jgi:hypothetical protein
MSTIIILQLAFAFFIAFLGLFIIHRVVTGFLVRNYQIEEHDNLALSIFQVGVIAGKCNSLIKSRGHLKFGYHGKCLGVYWFVCFDWNHCVFFGNYRRFSGNIPNDKSE